MSGDPVLIAYGVKRKRKTLGNYWQKIGEAYPHAEGAGLTLVLDAVPMDGRIVLLELDTNDDLRLLAKATRLAEDQKSTSSRKAPPGSER